MWNWINNLFNKKQKNTSVCFQHPANLPPRLAPVPLIANPFPAREINYTLSSDMDSNTAAETARIPLIENALNDFIHDDYFLKYFVDPKNGLDLNQTNGMTALDTVSFIRKSSYHLVISFYWEDTDVIGYHYPDENIIYCNRKFHDIYSITDEMSNVLHEALHAINFQHDFDPTDRRPNSVNYKANSAVENQ